MQSRLDRAGIETIESEDKNPFKAKLNYNGKTIFRQNTIDCVQVVKTAFGIDI